MACATSKTKKNVKLVDLPVQTVKGGQDTSVKGGGKKTGKTK